MLQQRDAGAESAVREKLMFSADLDHEFKVMLVSRWLGPEDYLALLYTSLHWTCTSFLRSSALFATSRMHAPGAACWGSMQRWHCVWKQCQQVFRDRGWPLELWKLCCTVSLDGTVFVPHGAFFRVLNEMLQAQDGGEEIASVLAVTVDFEV